MRKKTTLIMMLFILLSFVSVKALPEPSSAVKGLYLESAGDFSKGYIVTNSASLIINNVSENDRFTAYKILDVYYDIPTNNITYDFTTDFKNFLTQSETYKELTMTDYYNLTAGDILSGSTQSSSTLDKLTSAYAKYIKMSSTNLIEKYYLPVSNTTAKASLEAGTYLVLPTSSNRVYSVMVGNIVPTAGTNDNWQVNDFTINAKVSDPAIKKYIGKLDNIAGSYSFDEKIPVILVATLPLFPTNMNNEYYIITNLGNGFSIYDYDYTVKDGNTVLKANSDGTATDSSGNVVGSILPSDSSEYASITLLNGDMCDSYYYIIKINSKYMTTNKLTIEYNVKLNSGAIIGSTGNKSQTRIVYRNNYADFNEEIQSFPTGKTDATETAVYTYGIDLLAYKKGSKSTVLSDMTFEVYKDSELTKKIGTITTNSSGKGTLAGVAEGTYFLKNTKAKSGYKLANTTSMKVKTSGSVESDTEGYYKVEIEVPEQGLLPITGGKGTIIYTVIGLIIIISATVIYGTYKKTYL